MLYNAVMTLYIASAVISFAMLIIGIYARSAPKSLYFTLLTLSIFMLNLGYIFEIASSTYATAFIATQVQYFGGPFIAPLVLLFACEYCGVQLKTKTVLSVLAIPFAVLALVLTWPLNGIFYIDVEFISDGLVPRIVTTGSVFYIISHVYNAILPVVADGILIYHFMHGDKLFRRQSLMIIVATILPVFSIVFIFLFNAIGLSFDPTPIFLGIICLLLGYSILRLGLYHVAPIAREQIVETMHDAYIIIDMHGCFIDANIAAKQMFPQLAIASAGSKTDEIDGLSWICGNTESCADEFGMTDADGFTRYYKLSETHIKISNKNIARCIMFFDITETRQLLDEVSHLAESDPLTGLTNRRKFFSSGVLLFGNLARSGDSSCMMMIDIDFFKKVNDNYGHPKGDEVLRAIAGIMVSRFRSTDLIARYGGEEFCAFLPFISEQNALELAEQIRESTQELEFRSDNSSFKVTVSIGLATCDASRHLSLDMLLYEADAALYEAKNSGRNKVVVSSRDKGTVHMSCITRHESEINV